MTQRDETIVSMISRLIAASCFEDAATALLQAMLALAETKLASGEYAWSAASPRSSSSRSRAPSASAGRLLRGVVHLRPEAGYQHLFGIQHPGGAPVEGTGYLTSANVWRWVAEHRCSVSIDVQLGTIHPWLRDPAAAPDGGRQESETRGQEPAAGAPGDATRERMLDRDATHVHVVPLRAPSGAIDGMVTLEASCKAAIGDDLLWESACEPLAVLAGVAAPYLAALPPRPAASSPRTDAFLPVVGATTSSLVDLLCIFARQEETILIGGPTGAGKSRLARFCHERSTRCGQPFETLDLLGVPEELQMAELFGWKRGAFTGAVRDSAGALARAAQGTLFVDEVDKLSLKAQAGLLRVLEERRYRPIGDEAGERRADVRFVIGTNADLRGAVRAGRFREDLFYRINVLPVRLPPLSERLDELPAWADYMLRRRHDEARASGDPTPTPPQGGARNGGEQRAERSRGSLARGEGAVRLAPEAVKLLVGMPWPGNLRQLDNILRRAYVLALADRGAGALVLDHRHVERALAYEGHADTGALIAQLWRAAKSFVQEAELRSDSGAPLSLDACEALRGLVLAAAVQRRGRDEAFVLFGQQLLVKNRNHRRALRRELDRVRELVREIGGDLDADLAALLAAEESSEGR
jgi:DNA-binding NtrC family response regulator